MATHHPVWKGTIRLALVTVAVDLHAARDSTARTGFRQIHAPSGQPVSYDKVVEGVGPVQESDIRRGLETGKGEYVLLTDQEIEAVQLESRRTLELTRFVDPGEIDPLFHDKAYFVTPSAEVAETAYRVLRDALVATGKVGIGQIALRGREYLGALRAYGTGMLLETLYYREEVRDWHPYFGDIPEGGSDPDLVELATRLIEKKTARFDPDAYVDNYAEALRNIVREKVASGDPTVRTAVAPATTTDAEALLGALRKSVRTTRTLQRKRRPRKTVAPEPVREG
jgi:Ku protein, prokaryotic